MVSEENDLLAAGVTLFNDRRFWEAHEAWEQLWLHASGDRKRFLQGLIQLAAAYHHVRRGTFSGAIRLFRAAADKLDPFPAGYLQVDREVACRAAARHLRQVETGQPIGDEEFPKLHLRGR